MKLLVIGTGYVGLVTGASFAEMGHDVTCLDIDATKIHDLQEGRIPFYEPGLEEVVKRNSKAGRLDFTTDYSSALHNCQVCFLALPTPAKDDGRCDMSYVVSALDSIASHLMQSILIVNKSTMPVGSCAWAFDHLQMSLKQKGKEIPFDVVSNPEFLKEGDALNDFLKPDRIIIGAAKPESEEIMRELYAPFHINHDRIIVMDPSSAEMTKYAANAMLASRISFMNELSGLCEIVGADINKIRIGIGSDKRIGYSFLYAGAGFGGSCFPKDIQALRLFAEDHDYPMPLIKAIEEVNERQKRVLFEKIQHHFRHDIKGKTFAVWGLSFKPGTDDMRQAPSLVLIEELLRHGAFVKAFDPVAMEKARSLCRHPHLLYCENEKQSAKDADAIILMTEWKQFRFLCFSDIMKQMRGRAFFDGRNQYIRDEMAAKGLDYFGIGQPPSWRDKK